MQKIYLQTAPKHTRSMFIPHTPPVKVNSTETNSMHKTLLLLGLDINDIINSKPNLLTYFTPPNASLLKEKYSLTYLGPHVYNHFCNKIQNHFNINNSKYEVQNLTPKCFSIHMKKQIFCEQSFGKPDSWEVSNTPMYNISTSKATLRSQQ